LESGTKKVLGFSLGLQLQQHNYNNKQNPLFNQQKDL